MFIKKHTNADFNENEGYISDYKYIMSQTWSITSYLQYAKARGIILK